MLPPEAVLMSGPMLPLRVMSEPVVLLHPGSVLMSVACITIKAMHCLCSGLPPKAMVMSQGQAELSLYLLAGAGRTGPTPHWTWKS